MMLGILKRLFAVQDNTKLKKIIDSGALLIDVRSAGEFATGNIKGSVNIPLDGLSHKVQVLRKDKPIVVFCRSGARSMAARSILEKKGFSNIVDGGSINTINKLINAK